ncbi:MAG: PilZ domain-containing protein [Proteobacteria bacterium]|nr:PilZ domain-containing protein [Pseudomonadota bacterium]
MSVIEIKKESIPIHNVLSTLPRAHQYLSSSDKLTEQIVNEFKRGSKPIKLITQQKIVWTSAVVYNDRDFLYVRLPPEFEPETGALLLVQFPTKDGNYIIQTLIHKLNQPILYLKFQEPRRDVRYQPLSRIDLEYAEVNPKASGLLDDESIHIIRLAEESGRKIFVSDTLGVPKTEDEDGKPIFSDHQKKFYDLQSPYKKAGLHDISPGGVSINFDNGEIHKHTFMHIHLTLENENHIIKEIELSLLGIICNIFPLDEKSLRCGISFINRITIESFRTFLQQMNAS